MPDARHGNFDPDDNSMTAYDSTHERGSGSLDGSIPGARYNKELMRLLSMLEFFHDPNLYGTHDQEFEWEV